MARIRGSHRFAMGLLLLASVAAMALAASHVGGEPFRPSEALLLSPSRHHLMGTDALGREVGTRLLHGAATGLLVAVLSVVGATCIGVVVGMIAGYVGGVVDDVLLKLAEVFQVVPGFLLALVAAALFGPSRVLLAVVLAVIFWPLTARLVRAEVLALRERPFVQAARVLGARHPRILARHLLPAVLPLVVVNASFQAGTAVLIEAGLAFLGLGDRNAVSWGTMLADAQPYVAVAWWLSLFPGAAVAVTVLGMNLLGDGLNEVQAVGGTSPAATEGGPQLLRFWTRKWRLQQPTQGPEAEGTAGRR
ncbi:MAG: ABC transporter permease [Acidimicrobiales bacterium]